MSFGNVEQNFDEEGIRQDELIVFDRWFSSKHVCGKYAKVSEVRQWIHERIKELEIRKGGEP